MKEVSDLTIVVNSCDKYADAWEPFFTLLYQQWPECTYPVVLITETKKYEGAYPSVITFCAGERPWGKRLKSALKSIQSEIVLYFLEDFFLLQRVDHQGFIHALEDMKMHKDIGYIGLKYESNTTFRRDGIDKTGRYFNKDDLNVMHRVNNMTALWRRTWLIKLIRTYETPWEFDNYASVRSQKYPYRVLKINNLVVNPIFDYGVDLKLGYGISGGKWLRKNQELFMEHGINVDFGKMGFLDVDENGNRIVSKSSTGSSASWWKQTGSRLKKQFRRFVSTHI